MRTWKVRLSLGQANLILDIEAPTWDAATEAALVIAKRLGATFDYRMDEVKSNAH